jgi:hypothetical protein
VLKETVQSDEDAEWECVAMSADRRGVTAIRWIARAWSIASIGFVLLMFGGSALAEGFDPAQFTPRDWVGLFFFPLGVCLGLIVAWRREGLGGGMTVGSFLAFYATLRITDGRFPRGPWFALVAAPGILFLVCWLLSRGYGECE